MRLSKIARLPHTIREQLNRRMQDGETGRTILTWLNSLPETQRVMTEQFLGKPVRHQNLSEWRYTGYQDWLKQQERLIWYTHLTEHEREIRNQRKGNDAFEAFGFFMLAEQGQALAELQEEKDPDARQTRLENLTLQFTRLQNAFSRSRHIALWWTKWNEGKAMTGRAPRLLDPRDYEQKDSPPEISTTPSGMQPSEAIAGSAKPEITIPTVDCGLRTVDSGPSPNSQTSPDAGLRPDHSTSHPLDTRLSPLAPRAGEDDDEAQPETPSQPALRPDHSTPDPLDPRPSTLNTPADEDDADTDAQPETPPQPELCAPAPLDTRPSTPATPEGTFHPIPPIATNTPVNPPFPPPPPPPYRVSSLPIRGRRFRCIEG